MPRHPFHSAFAIKRFFQWIRSVLFYEHWMVGIIDEPISHALNWKQTPPIRWIAPFSKDYYLADPFPWPGSQDTIMCEDYDMKTQQGHIVALRLNENGVLGKIDIDLPLEGHLSFPFLFAFEGKVCVMPEACSAKRLEIFEWQQTSDRWVSSSLIFANECVADAVLFEHEGLYWISYTDVSRDPHDNLNLIYASSLKGPWKKHPRNPVKQGRDVSRNGGGIFEVGGVLYRPAQDCSKVYGGGLKIMKIISCTPTDYREEEVTSFAPTSSLYSDGFHTLQAWGDKCLVDGMRLTFSWRLMRQKLYRRLGL